MCWVEIAQRIREDITDRPIHLTTEDSCNIISASPDQMAMRRRCLPPNGMTIFIMPSTFCDRRDSSLLGNDFSCLMPRKTPRKSAGRSDLRCALSGEISPQTGEPLAA
ncbi:hypothetical protein KCP77_14660 [Salmonella enterica subsp. enterica]|nr:hypothetical protein KCP77_14660 [Salmonella enterica subsp. enterica]